MPSSPEHITYFAETDMRSRKTRFGIKAADRTKHMYVIGKSGMGKSTLLENMAIQDIKNGEGLAFFDPHGAAATKLLDYIPENRVQDVIYFAPFDVDHPVGFNVMEDVGYDKRHLVVAGLMSAFRKIWVDAWSSRMEYILENTLLALLEYPDATMLDINRMLIDKNFRKKVVDNVTDPIVKAFWEEEFAKYTDRYTQEATPAIQNKVGQFTANPLIRNIIGQPSSSFDLRDILDSKKIFIADLSKGRIGEKNAQLLGSMLVTKFYLAALSRADVSSAELEQLPNFYFYVDEFQSFANESFADILSEARKYKLNLIVAHQYIEQMPEEVRAAVFGNVGTMVTFRIGAYDADVLEKEFSPQFTAEDLVNLGFAQIYLKLMIDGVSSQPFSATTLPPIEPNSASYKDESVNFSRKSYGRPREEIEAIVSNRNNPYQEDTRTPQQEQDEQNRGQKKTEHREKQGQHKQRQQDSRQGGNRDTQHGRHKEESISLSELSKKGGEKKSEGNRKSNNQSNNGAQKDDLRNALSSVLKDAQSQQKQKQSDGGESNSKGNTQKEKPDQKKREKHDTRPAHGNGEKKQHEHEKPKREQQQHTTHTQQQSQTHHEYAQHESNKGNGAAHEQRKKQESSEIPEDVLRSVIAVDEENTQKQNRDT